MKTIRCILTIFIICSNLTIAQEVILYNETNSPLISGYLSSIAIDSSNIVWVGGYSEQLFTYDGTWNSLDDVWNLFHGNGIGDIGVSPNGSIWVTVSSEFGGAIFSFSNQKWNFLTIGSGTFHPVSIFIDNDSTIYFTLINYWAHLMYSDEIAILSNDSLRTERFPCLKSVVPYAKDTMIVASCLLGISKFNGDSIIDINPEDWVPEGLEQLKLAKINNEIFVYSERLRKYENGQYIKYPIIDSVMSSDTSSITSIAMEGENILWIGTDKGRLIRFNGNIEVFKLSSCAIRDINIDKYKNKWFISWEGCFVFNENKIVKVEQELKLPLSYSLSQNYPNPFNPNTKIQYSLSKSGNTQIYIYDVLGRKIMKLVDEYKVAGSYEVEFNAEYLSNGIYFYKIVSANYSETKKMVLLK